MEWIVFYLVGCGLDILMLALHMLLGYFFIGPWLKPNYEKVGIYISYLGHMGEEPIKIRGHIIDIFISWIAVVANLVTFVKRLIIFLNIGSKTPREILDIQYRLSNFNLTSEEVFVLLLKMKHIVSGVRFLKQDVLDELERSQYRIVGKLNPSVVLELLKEHGLLKAEAS